MAKVKGRLVHNVRTKSEGEEWIRRHEYEYHGKLTLKKNNYTGGYMINYHPGLSAYGRITNPPRDQWIKVKAVKFLRNGGVAMKV
jgi:hypothetical protein